jgi:hypothetical protein
MVTNVSIGTTQISGSVAVTGLTVPSATQTLIKAEFSNVAAASTVYTVTAGKTFYLMGYTWNTSATSYGGIAGIKQRTGTSGGLINASVPLTSVSASTNITIVSETASNYGGLWGFEV